MKKNGCFACCGLVSDDCTLKMLDHCLALGSKDNMTSLVVKFPAQKLGEGGGVAARRQARDSGAGDEAGGMS